MYHRVAQEEFDPWGLAVSPDHFAQQLQWLSKNRTVLPLARFAAMHRETTLPRDAVALTFDDAYECTAEIAAPLLQQAGLPATIFIPAELIERGRPFWWDELQHLVLGHDGDGLELAGEQIILGPPHIDDRRWKPDAPPRTPRQAAFQHIWASLREKAPAELDDAMTSVRRQAGPARQSKIAAPMSAAKVRETASELIEFGSHALTHPWLTSLPQDEKRREISDSVARVERLAGRRPTSFAYPYGNLDAESEQLVEEAGFECACATLGTAVSPASRLFALPRKQVGDWDSQTFASLLGCS
jgi:peptidoglycan/xylan/chitin deacetylase (PgdA/CDA1 family)